MQCFRRNVVRMDHIRACNMCGHVSHHPLRFRNDRYTRTHTRAPSTHPKDPFPSSLPTSITLSISPHLTFFPSMHSFVTLFNTTKTQMIIKGKSYNKSIASTSDGSGYNGYDHILCHQYLQRTLFTKFPLAIITCEGFLTGMLLTMTLHCKHGVK
jgi:hypothetical protein